MSLYRFAYVVIINSMKYFTEILFNAKNPHRKMHMYIHT